VPTILVEAAVSLTDVIQNHFMTLAEKALYTAAVLMQVSDERIIISIFSFLEGHYT